LLGYRYPGLKAYSTEIGDIRCRIMTDGFRRRLLSVIFSPLGLSRR